MNFKAICRINHGNMADLNFCPRSTLTVQTTSDVAGTLFHVRLLATPAWGNLFVLCEVRLDTLSSKSFSQSQTRKLQIAFQSISEEENAI